MQELQLGVAESRFADVIWGSEPITSSELVKKCEQLFQWKKSTTFTVLKRLIEKGIFKNESGTVTSLISRDDFYTRQSERLISRAFDGSLPTFVAAFSQRKPLTKEEVDELRRFIDAYEVKE